MTTVVNQSAYVAHRKARAGLLLMWSRSLPVHGLTFDKWLMSR